MHDRSSLQKDICDVVLIQFPEEHYSCNMVKIISKICLHVEDKNANAFVILLKKFSASHTANPSM